MKSALLLLLKAVLVLLLVALVILGIIALVYSFDWPWWTSIFLLLGVISLVLVGWLIRRMWLKRREERFVSEIIRREEMSAAGLSEAKRRESREMQERWKDAVSSLRKSHLRKRGNPLYVLPWYMIVGESGSGKTTAIESARLSSPFAETRKVAGISGTRNFDWWFFEQAVLLDTAGRYAIPVDEGHDKEEWQKFIANLVKYRKREPLNGLVLTVEAERLLKDSPEELERYGMELRRRVDELMRALGMKFPVYLLVTKCDRIQGMAPFCKVLPDAVLNQAMGVLHRDVESDAVEFARQAVSTTAERLKNLRLLVLHSLSADTVDPALIIFPEEFEKTAEGLAAFATGAFKDNPYQESPIFRGIFFSSGRQEGAPFSHFLQLLGLSEKKDLLPETHKGLFLHDVFSRILPADRTLYAPTGRALSWNRLSRNLLLVSWLTLGLAVSGLLSWSFVKNLGTLRDFSDSFGKPAAVTGDIYVDSFSLEKFRTALQEMEKANRGWVLPRLGLTKTIAVENELKTRYCERFRMAFLEPLDKELAEEIYAEQGLGDDISYGACVMHVARRINLVDDRLEGESVQELLAEPQPPFTGLSLRSIKGMDHEMQEPLAVLYDHYLAWNNQESSLRDEHTGLESLLSHLLVKKRRDFDWVIPWINFHERELAYTLKDFWGVGPEYSPQAAVAVEEGAAAQPAVLPPQVEPVYTQQGAGKIETLMEEIEEALKDPSLVPGFRKEFYDDYKREYLLSWQAFAADFAMGETYLQSAEERRRVFDVAPSDQGPHFAFMDTLLAELKAYAAGGAAEWTDALLEYQVARGIAATLGDKDVSVPSRGLLGKAVGKGKRVISKLEKLESVSPDARRQRQIAEELLAYRVALHDMATEAASQRLAFDMARTAFEEDASVSENPVHRAGRSYADMSSLMAQDGKGGDLVYALLRGPLDYMWRHALDESGCRLQEIWDEDVYAEVADFIDRNALKDALVQDDGVLWKFADKGGPADPFIKRGSGRGYQPEQVLGQSIAFTDSFFHLLDNAKKTSKVIFPAAGARYSVSLRGLPTGTNGGALQKPHMTVLRVQCVPQSQTLVNRNYPVRAMIDWSMGQCSDTTLEIYVGDLLLTKRWSGDFGFANFLSEFRSGTKRYTPADFPEQRKALEAMNITYIHLEYDISGHGELIKLAAAQRGPSLRVPKTIAACGMQ